IVQLRASERVDIRVRGWHEAEVDGAAGRGMSLLARIRNQRLQRVDRFIEAGRLARGFPPFAHTVFARRRYPSLQHMLALPFHGFRVQPLDAGGALAPDGAEFVEEVQPAEDPVVAPDHESRFAHAVTARV